MVLDKSIGTYADNWLYRTSASDSTSMKWEYTDASTVGSTYDTVIPTKIIYETDYGKIIYETDYGTNECTIKDIYRMWKDHTTASTSTTWYDYKWKGINRPITPEQQMRDIIRSRQAPAFIRSRKTIDHANDPREFRARETLRRVLGNGKYQRFIRDGFVSVQAKSGLVYQIFPGHGMTNVFDRGVQTEKLCVVLRGNFPPTDSLIMRYLLILNDERDFRKHAIEHGFSQRIQRQQSNDQIIQPLNDVWKKIKVAA